MRKIAISDIHGCAQTFRVLVKEQLKLQPEDELYLLGDYVDRGPDSKGVFDYIWELQEDGFQLTCLRGNHEVMMMDALNGGNPLEMWLTNGGDATLRSFGVGEIDHVPGIYLNFMDELDYYAEVDEFILVHAGLNFRKHNPLEIGEDMMWIRWWYDELDRNWLGDRIIIHGHTPIEMKKILRMSKRMKHLQVLDIDNGCFATFQHDMGQLCAFDMTNRTLYFQPNVDY